jgi:hypothetical protein
MAAQPASKIVKVNDIVGVDEEHGLVFGFAIVSTVDGEPYFDLNVDQEGIHKGQKVPENIPDEAVLDCYVDVRKSSTDLPGNVMHEGPDSGVYYDLFPLTAEIAKALEITTKRTGLLCVYKPEADVLAKFKNGTFKGFSIEGARIEYQEIEG